MDFSTSRLNGNPSLGIYRKHTQTDTTIHFVSNHPMKHKLATNLFHINAMITLPIIEERKHQEWKIILLIAKNKVFPLKMIHGLKDKIRQKQTRYQNYFYTNTKEEKMDHSHIIALLYVRSLIYLNTLVEVLPSGLPLPYVVSHVTKRHKT